MQQPAIGLIQSLSTGFGQKLFKPGAIVSFSALEQLSDSSWIIQVHGQKIKVRSSITLTLGEQIKARVLFQDGKMFLKMEDSRSPIQHLLYKLDLPKGSSSELLIRSFIEQGMPLKEETLRKALQLMEQLDNRDRRTARLIAMLYDKGMFLTRQQFEKLQQFIFEKQIPLPPSTERRKKDHDSDRKESKEREDQRKKERDKLLKSIKNQINRSSRGDNLLQLFNHLKAPHDNWIVVPLSFDYPAMEDAPRRGVLRIHITTQNMPDMCTFTVFGRREWHFKIKLQPGKERISLAVDPYPSWIPEKEIVNKMREKLSNLSFEIDDTISEMVKFSLFGDSNRQDIKNVDTTI